MDLQLALLLIGTILVVIVALTAYDKGRVAKSFRAGFGLRGRTPTVVTAARREPMVPGATGLHPGATSAKASVDADRKFLKTDVEVPIELMVEPEPDPLAAELGEMEAIANRPLNLNPGFDPPGTGPELAAQLSGRQTMPNEAVDFVLHLPGPGPVTRRTALGIYKQNEYKLEYPRDLFGQRYQTNFWSTLQHDSDATQYADLKLSIQLVDHRHGPIQETELNAFVQVGLKLADALHRPAKFSIPFEQAIDRAKQLQKFCDEYDVIAGLSVVIDGATPFKGHAIAAAMARVGMELGAMNIFHKRAAGKLLFSVSNLYKPGNFNPAAWEEFRTSGLTLFMSVPCVEAPAAIFGEMVQVGQELAKFLGGQLLDQDRRPLTERGVNAIRAQIQGIDGKMRLFGIAPGSDAALRLFGTGLS